MSDGPPVELAELAVMDLDGCGVSSLVEQIVAHGRVLELRCKQHAYTRGVQECDSLFDASLALKAGRLRGLQVTYAWGDQTWIDTLIAAGDTFKLTRRFLNNTMEECS